MPGFLFSDIEGSTRLWEKHSEIMSAALARHNEILRSTIETCGGKVIKSTGDGFLVLFETGNPLDCAIKMQIAMQQEKWPEAIGQLRIRIGIHSGKFERRDSSGDIYGSDVNRAARVMDAGWGGQILITDRKKIDYILPKDASLQDLGTHLLKDLSEPQPLFGLVHPDLRQDFPPPRSLSSQPNNLPILPTTFIGRKDEIKAIGDMLRTNTCQLITLHGPGGIGKTRLSIEAAMSFLKHYPFGAYFVPLAPLSDPSAIWQAVASAVNLPLYEDKQPKVQVLNYLKQKEVLLVLDNFEHLHSGAGMIGELLDAAPKLHALVTSRTRLQLQKECVYAVNGLQFPERADEQIFEDFEAVQLFTNLAQRADPSYKLTEKDYPAIVEICKLMDGMPLGIELASHWVRVISPQEIVDELREDIDLLKTEMVDVPDRHRSMRAMFDYSWRLLNEKEQHALKSLSIFRGGCTLAAAKAVAGASLLVISSLVDKSLVKRSEQGRYEMHELVRQLAEEKLRADQETLNAIQVAHCQYYLTMLAEKEADLKGGDQINALNNLDADFENLRLAWQSAVDSGQEELVGNALESFFWMLTYRNHYAAGQELFERARRKWSDQEAAPSLYHRLQIRFPEKDHDLEAVFQSAVDSARQRDAKHELGLALNLLGKYIGHILVEQARGFEIMNESLEIFKHLGDDFYIGHVLDDIAFNQIHNIEERVAYAEKSLAVREKSGDLFGTAGVLGNLIIAYFVTNRFEEMDKLTERGIKLTQQTNDILNFAWLHIYICELRQFQGRFQEAMDAVQVAEKIARDLGEDDLRKQVNINKSLNIMILEQDYLKAKKIMENTIPVDAEPSMHSTNAPLAYCMIAAGLGDVESLKLAAGIHYKSMQYTDSGFLGKLWFSPIIHILLYYTQNYVASAECIGFIRKKMTTSNFWLTQWPLMDQIDKKLIEILGEDKYQEAVSRGEKSTFEEFLKSADFYS
jgi:predicted ATPase/class 3 adenylate cyclase